MNTRREEIVLHTQGAWLVLTERPNPHWRGDGTEILSEYGRIADAGAGGLRLLDECRANARLIAAAPELLEALKAAQKRLEQIDDDCKPAVDVRLLIGAALAKSVGA